MIEGKKNKKIHLDFLISMLTIYFKYDVYKIFISSEKYLWQVQQGITLL